jgi:hypothetical protein
VRQFLFTIAVGGAALLPPSADAQNTEAIANLFQYRSVVALKEFGAVCDGVTDDTTTIQLALSSGAQRVLASSGVCATSTLSVPSNVELVGEGSSTVFLLNNWTNGSVIAVGYGASNVVLRNFKVSANSRNQTPNGNSSGVFVHQTASRVLIENVSVDDVADWGFHINGSEVTLRHTRVTNITGARGEHAVRAGYLVGSGIPPVAASRVTIENADVTECALPHTDGFILERGTEIVLQHSRAVGCSWTCFKLKSNQTLVSGNSASDCGVGFQTQGPLQDLTLSHNKSSTNKGSGYQFNQVSSVAAARNWRITHNEAMNNGQPPGNSTTYGFAFENLPGAHADDVFIDANTAIDNQPVTTQARGISFGTFGRYRNVRLFNNVAKGNKIDYYLGPALDLDSLTDGQNNVGSAGRQLLRSVK